MVGGVDAAYDHITLGTWLVNVVGQHYLVAQAFNQTFWSIVVLRQMTGECNLCLRRNGSLSDRLHVARY